MSDLLYIWPDVRSSSWLVITSQWRNIEILPIQDKHRKDGSVQFFQDHVPLGHLWWLRCKFWSVTPLKVIWGHQQFLTITCDCEEVETWEVSLCLSRQYTSNSTHNMQHDLLGSPLVLWPEIRFRLWPFKINMYIFRCILTREKRYRSNYVDSLLWSKVSSENHVIKTILNFHDLWRLTYWPQVKSDRKTLPSSCVSQAIFCFI